MEVNIGGLIFSSNFDSGNLYRVELVLNSKQGKVLSTQLPNFEFNLWTKVDAADTEYQNKFRSWFYYSIKGSKQHLMLKFNIMNLNRHSKVFTNNMYPVYMISGQQRWQKIKEKPVFVDTGENSVLSFCHPIEKRQKIYFALCYPYPYKDVINFLDRIDAKYSSKNKFSFPNEEIYYFRECLCHSLEGRDVDLITITSTCGISSEREPRLENLFPDWEVPRPHIFPNKKIIFITARVHPAETSSSFVLDGIITSLINREDPGAAQLRKKYVFKLIPVLNPDGVYRGHYRTDSRGVNLNRVYQNPCLESYPSIYATCSLIKYYHTVHQPCDSYTFNQNAEESQLLVDGQIPHPEKDREFSRKKEKDEIATSGKNSKIFLYLDLHSHASRKEPHQDLASSSTSATGFFLYGNNFSTVEECVETRVFAKLMEINCKSFSYSSCDFSESSMHTKDKAGNGSRDGTGRVWVMNQTGITYAYTFEAHYNAGQVETCIPRKGGQLESKFWISNMPAEFCTPTYEGVGRSILQSILDLNGPNTWSRLYSSSMKSLMKIRDSLRKELSYKASYNENITKTLKPVVRVVGISTQKASSQAALKTGAVKKRPGMKPDNYKELHPKESEKVDMDPKFDVNKKKIAQNKVDEQTSSNKEDNVQVLSKEIENVEETFTKMTCEYECTKYVLPISNNVGKRNEEKGVKSNTTLNVVENPETQEDNIHKEDTDCCPPF